MQNDRTSMRGFAPGLALGALLLVALPVRHVAAQELTGFPQAELPRYTVELIVFSYAEGATTGNEIFVPESPPFDEYMTAGSAGMPEGEVRVFSDRAEPDEQAIGNPAAGRSPGNPSGTPEALPPQAGGPGAEPGDGSLDGEDAANEITGAEPSLGDIPLRARIELRLLPPEQYSMDAIHRELIELDAYQPIMRTAWTQTAPAPGEAPAIRLRALGSPPPGLDGTVTLYQGRFVHLGLDLELDAEGAYASGGTGFDSRSATDRAIAGSLGENPDGNGSSADEPPGTIPVYSDRGYGEAYGREDGAFFPQPVRYRIEEVRIMRDGEIRYYDHPRYGVIAKLTEVKEEAAAADTRP
jgi:Peptidoglycan-binding protein, CsiV